jgi:hypothetical protein
MGLILATKRFKRWKKGANNDDNNQPNKAGNPKQTVATDRTPLNHSPSKQSSIHCFHAWRAWCLPEIEIAGTNHV